MTEIYRVNGLSIQVFDIARAARVNGTTNVDVTLDRAGRFLGGSITMDSALPTTDVVNTEITLVNPASGELTYGVAVSQIRARINNNNAGAVLLGAHVVVFIGVA